MSDPITTVVTVISEHPQAAAAVASIYGVAKPFLAKILGPSAEEIGEIGRDYIKGRRGKNTERTLGDADKLLVEAGREPQEVPLAVVVPLLEAASLQEEPALAERWAALLANAADPAQRVQVRLGFIETLRQLTSLDARALVLVYQEARADDTDPANQSLVWTSQFEEKLGVTRDELLMSIEELVRLKLCDANFLRFTKMLGSKEPTKFASSVYQTIYGRAFLAAVTPPTP